MWVLQWLVQGLAVALVATLAAQLVPSSAPRLRHRFWWLALAAVVALPWMSNMVAPHAVVTTLGAPVRALALEVTAPPSWLWTACVALWGSTTLVALGALLADLRALRALKGTARPLPWPTSRETDDLRATAATVRGARLAMSDDLAGACAAGFFTPRVIVSSRLASSLEPAALDAIVRHELANLARFDDWLRLLQRFVLAAAGLHPAVRWISRQIDVEREAACDRLVVEQVGDSHGYARALTAVAELTAGVRRTAPLVAPGAVVPGGGLHARVVRLLRDEMVPSPRRVRATAVASLATLALAVSGVAALPPLVTTASLEPSLSALASLPAGRALVSRWPELRGRAVPASRQAAAAVVRQVPAEPASVTPQPPSPWSTSAEANAVEPDAPARLVAAETLDVPARRELRIDTGGPAGGAQGLGDAIGARASRAGAAVGSRAAHAGSALGRIFSKGGQAVAGTFFGSTPPVR